MPLYEYRCDKCDRSTDHMIGMNDNAPRCPFCDGETSRVFSPPKVIRSSGPKGGIYDWRQVDSTHGKNWRYTSGSERPGGARQKIYFHD
jgi:putative FmdB family regulatory protein